MEDADFAEEHDRNATTFTLADLGTEVDEKGFDITPRDITARWVCEHQLQRSLVSPLHSSIVPLNGTTHNGIRTALQLRR